jgi:hypothetical protein
VEQTLAALLLHLRCGDCRADSELHCASKSEAAVCRLPLRLLQVVRVLLLVRVGMRVLVLVQVLMLTLLRMWGAGKGHEAAAQRSRRLR